MKYLHIIGILCVMLAIIGTANADVFTFEDSSGGTYATGQITFDDNGIINGACVAGVTNGDMDVQQGSSQNGENVAVWQYGDIEGEGGFAGTLVDGGNGNQGGTFASFSSGGMVFGQVSAGGEISSEFIPDFPLESSGNQLSQVEDVSTSLSGVIAGQFAGIEGSSGYAATAAGNRNGASSSSTASFSEGGMIVGQVSGVGEMSSLNTYGTQVSIPAINQDVVFSSQIGGIQAGSGSASTTGRTENGALAQTDVSFTDGTICFEQFVDGESFSFLEGRSLGGVVPGLSVDEIRSYQSVGSEHFSTISASSYSQLPDGSYVQVNAAAAGSANSFANQLSKPSPRSYFDVTQGTASESYSSSGVTYELGIPIHYHKNYQDAFEEVNINDVDSGSAGTIARDSTGNTASTLAYVVQGSLSADEIYAETYRYEPQNLLGDGMVGDAEGPASEVEAGYYDVNVAGNSGGILLDSRNSIGESLHASFPASGYLSSYHGYANAGHDEYNYFVNLDSDLLP